MIRSSALTNFNYLVKKLGGDSSALLKKVSLTTKDLKDPEGFILFSSYVELLEYASKELNSPNFGLILSTYQDIRVLGDLGLLMVHCGTVREALHCAQRYYAIHNTSSVSWSVHEGRDISYITRFEQASTLSYASQHRELALSLCGHLLRRLVGFPIEELRLNFSHNQTSDCRFYKKILHADIKFNQESERLIFSSKYMDVSIKSFNDKIRQQVESDLVKSLQNHKDDVVQQVKILILQTLFVRKQNIEHVAKTLNLHPRNLQRKLEDKNQTFKSILTQTRLNLACWHLQSSQKSISHISKLLGYKELSSFSRAFKKQKKCSALRWRRQNTTL